MKSNAERVFLKKNFTASAPVIFKVNEASELGAQAAPAVEQRMIRGAKMIRANIKAERGWPSSSSYSSELPESTADVAHRERDPLAARPTAPLQRNHSRGSKFAIVKSKGVASTSRANLKRASIPEEPDSEASTSTVQLDSALVSKKSKGVASTSRARLYESCTIFWLVAAAPEDPYVRDILESLIEPETLQSLNEWTRGSYSHELHYKSFLHCDLDRQYGQAIERDPAFKAALDRVRRDLSCVRNTNVTKTSEFDSVIWNPASAAGRGYINLKKFNYPLARDNAFRALRDFKIHRNRYYFVPDKAFSRTQLAILKIQIFSTFAQHSSAIRHIVLRDVEEVLYLEGQLDAALLQNEINDLEFDYDLLLNFVPDERIRMIPRLLRNSANEIMLGPPRMEQNVVAGPIRNNANDKYNDLNNQFEILLTDESTINFYKETIKFYKKTIRYEDLTEILKNQTNTLLKRSISFLFCDYLIPKIKESIKDSEIVKNLKLCRFRMKNLVLEAKLSWASEFRLRQVQKWNCVPTRIGAAFYSAGRSARELAAAMCRNGDTHAGVSFHGSNAKCLI
ncbi:unnamed protein product [Trichogramma brassicae]|uniref:Uncharacterized protein n=1 Tax=Trichogramma brassicae TaxID=86971 RepID=A0A6H5I6R9_9HYME|nr:unnamed protein product [Trichogramma brassicae]